VIPEEPIAQWVPYRGYPIAGGMIGRPVVTVEFIHGNLRHSLLMLVDPGADEVVLPRHAVTYLGIDELDCHHASSARTLYGLMERLVSPPVRLEFPDYWGDWGFEAEIVFSSGIDPFEYGLLGREPTLEHLTITFGHELGYGFQMERRL
jgi:hypothetical protein